MPEGDTIHRAAARLQAVLQGEIVQKAESHWLGATTASLEAQRIVQVAARGKHLLMIFADERVLHSHMGMTGSWHIYRPGEPWQKPTQRAAIWLECREVCVVCFTPKLLEFLTAAAFRRHDYLHRLGPDLLAGPRSDEEVLARFRQCDNLPIGQAVLNQTIISGIGNVYKSEVLFLLGLHPQTLVRDLRDELILELTAMSAELMGQNLSGRPRTTRHALDGGRFHVYWRSGEPCFRCGTRIEVIRQGDAGRTTYFCPLCQLIHKVK